jgi:hydrogenase maturation protease
MARTLILGYGNPLRSDDGLGWRAAETLATTLSSDQVEVRSCHQLLPELTSAISQAETTLFIDAAIDGEPGEVRCEPVFPRLEGDRFTHQLSPAAILAWSQKLYGKCPRAFVISVAGGCFELGEKLSPAVAASLPRLTALVGQLANHFNSL